MLLFYKNIQNPALIIKQALRTGTKTLKEFADHLKQEHLDALERKAKPVFHKIGIPYKGKNEQYYSYCNTHHIHNFGSQRLVTPALAGGARVNYRQADLKDNPVFYISNRFKWQAAGITRIRRHRWLLVELVETRGGLSRRRQGRRSGSVSTAGLQCHPTPCRFGRRGLQLTACQPTRPCPSRTTSAPTQDQA
jgi:hypothetical protein